MFVRLEFKVLVAGFLGILVASLNSCRTRNEAENEVKTYGFDNSEGDLDFESYLFVLNSQSDTKVYSSVPEFKAVYAKKIETELELQIRHIFSSLTNQGEYVKYPGVVANTYNPPKILKETLSPDGKGIRIDYHAHDKIALHNKHYNGAKADIDFYLPAEISQLYAKGFPHNSRLNKCTDHHYNSWDDFWYFWDPKKRGCPLTDADLVKVTGHVVKTPQKPKTYPEYQLLYGDNGNGKNLKVVVLYGIDESYDSGDLGRSAYQGFLQKIKKDGFIEDKVRSVKKHKIFNLTKNNINIELHAELADPDDDKDFQIFVTDAMNGNGKLEDAADIFIYSGHSGLGGYLDPERFGKKYGDPIALPKNKYQIFAFQGCSSYAYYNRSYMALKRSEQDRVGSKYLDIITAGIGIAFGVSPQQEYVIVRDLVSHRKLTWQNIMDDVYLVDPENTALHQVNGDEDNPTSME
jgi:hypothetical protein